MNKLLVTRASVVVGLLFVFANCGGESDSTPSKPATKAPSKQAVDKAPAKAADKAPKETPPAPPAPAAEPATTVALATLGHQLDVPASWGHKQLNENAYTFDIKGTKTGGVLVMTTLAITRVLTAPAGAEAAAKKCGGTLLETKTLDNGHFYYTCELEAAGQKIHSMDYFVPTKDGGLKCAGGGDIAATLAACKTLRPLP